jgi:hypothetical protein
MYIGAGFGDSSVLKNHVRLAVALNIGDIC